MIETILVVDEYDTHRVGLASVLRKATGADVIAARNGRIALTRSASSDGTSWCSTSTCPT